MSEEWIIRPETDKDYDLELKTGALEGVRGLVKYPRAFGLPPEWTLEVRDGIR
jgi:hypothetical protein